MKIKQIDIKNYRNFDNINLIFHPNLTFIIGENNIGKTNILDLLDTIFNKRSFYKDDFKDVNTAIEIELKLELDNIEIGIFDDLFSPEKITSENGSIEINLLIKQENPDDSIKIFHKETDEEISSRKLRFANLIRYDPLRKPGDELDFSKSRGAGKFLSYLVKKHFNNEPNAYIKDSELTQLISKINKDLETFQYFHNLGVKVGYKKEVFDQILSLLDLLDKDEITIFSTGYGVQYNLIIFFYILNKTIEILESEKKEDSIFTDTNGKKSISLILCIDEPEIHMHPYMQRSLVKTVHKMLTNNDESFKNFLKENFNIDHIYGQAIIVTHSPNVLLNDYKQYVRLYYSKKLSSISGQSIQLENAIEKHLYKQIQYIKEAFFSKCVIIVEGDTEYGALPEWFEKSGIDMDMLGLSIIKADGKKSIKPLKKLLEKFGIECLTLADKDDGNDNNYDFITNGRDFEEDVVNSLFDFSDNKEIEKKELIYKILAEIDPKNFNEEQRASIKIEELNKEDTLRAPLKT
ncbi:AAA family ATPase, partial [Treponema sp. J25]|uniref:ATP-dependent nuclease n=1 Tax=Treponema sp. J25 TaxID=2094121 RepID=UPI001045A979